MKEAETRACPKCGARLMLHLNQCPSCGFHFGGNEAQRQFRTGVWLVLASPFVGLGSCYLATLTEPSPIGAMLNLTAALAVFGTLIGLILLIGTMGIRRDE